MKDFLESYKENRLSIFEAWYNGSINEEQRDVLLEKMDEQYALYTESLKDVKDKAVKFTKDKVEKIGNSKAATALNNGMNASSTVIAKGIVKDPTKGGKISVDESVYEKYQKDMTRVRAMIKAGEFLLGELIFVGPFEMVFNACVFTAVSKSDDPADKEFQKAVEFLKSKCTALKEKFKQVVSRIKGKKIEKNEAIKEVKALDVGCAALAKQCDRINRIRAKIKSGEVKPTKLGAGKTFKVKKVSEAVIEHIDTYLMESTDGDALYDMLNMIIEKTDFDKVDVFSLVFEYLDI